jgi:hypothetical protein
MIKALLAHYLLKRVLLVVAHDPEAVERRTQVRCTAIQEWLTQGEQWGGKLDAQDSGRLVGADLAQAVGDHNGFVVAGPRPCHRLVENAEVPRQVGVAEFVVERGAAQRAVEHDLQRAGDVFGLAKRRLPPTARWCWAGAGSRC